jgi:hypothetical protein
MRAYVKEMAELGVDSIKMLLSGDDAFAEGASQQLTYTEEEVAAAANEAHARGLWLSCHAQSAESIKLALRHGFRILYHCSHADEETLDLLEAQKDKIFVAPAVGLRYARMYEAESFGITRAVAEKMGVLAEVERMQRLYPAMRRRGIRVLPGGDYGFPYNPVGRNARDLELFVMLFGYTEKEVLVAATKLGGELMGLPVGVIKPDWRADLLLVQGNSCCCHFAGTAAVVAGDERWPIYPAQQHSPPLAPHGARRLDRQPQLGFLLGFGQQIAFQCRGETTLRTQGEAFERHIAGRFRDALLEFRFGFERGLFRTDQPQHHAAIFRHFRQWLETARTRVIEFQQKAMEAGLAKDFRNRAVIACRIKLALIVAAT